MGEHVFDKDSVSPRGVIYKDVGDGTDNFPVLEDRGTAHALDDSTGFFKQSFIRYLDFDSAVDVVVIQVKGFDFDRIELRRSVLLQAAQDLCFSFFTSCFNPTGSASPCISSASSWLRVPKIPSTEFMEIAPIRFSFL